MSSWRLRNCWGSVSQGSLLAGGLIAGVDVPGLLGCGSSPGTQGTITTVAGDNKLGHSGDGGAATAAEMYDPTCVALSGNGNLMIGDLEEVDVREVALGTGIISTGAGTGVPGYSGDGGPVTQAEMYGPSACATDAAGNLYLADDANNVMRKVNAATGIITTIAGNGLDHGTGSGGFSGDGGPATQAEINHSFGVVVDTAGNVYLADTYNYRVRRIVAATGIILSRGLCQRCRTQGYVQLTKEEGIA
jgi:hypothetical protein